MFEINALFPQSSLFYTPVSFHPIKSTIGWPSGSYLFPKKHGLKWNPKSFPDAVWGIANVKNQGGTR